ncbi:hypothetical protein BASA61_006149 [Batrachochytrium salamandrivorans]|nr:hypothetical protein BASA60_005363 [Batrachochytrium salamandrivorans]KAH6588000.1 hypothetical protein BASA61_006149 [Batrachochytrium salamandrivorans]
MSSQNERPSTTANMANKLSNDALPIYRGQELGHRVIEIHSHLPEHSQSPLPSRPKGSWKRIFSASSHVSVVPSDWKIDTSEDQNSETLSRSSITSSNYNISNTDGPRGPRFGAKLSGLTSKIAQLVTRKGRELRPRTISQSADALYSSEYDAPNDGDESGAASSFFGSPSLRHVLKAMQRDDSSNSAAEGSGVSVNAPRDTILTEPQAQETISSTDQARLVGNPMINVSDTIVTDSNMPLPIQEMATIAILQPTIAPGMEVGGPQSGHRVKKRPTSVQHNRSVPSSTNEERVLTALTGGSPDIPVYKEATLMEYPVSLIADGIDHDRPKHRAVHGGRNRLLRRSTEVLAKNNALDDPDDPVASLERKEGSVKNKTGVNYKRGSGSKMFSNIRSKSIISINFEEQFGRPSPGDIANNIERFFPGISDIRVDLVDTDEEKVDEMDAPIEQSTNSPKESEHHSLSNTDRACVRDTDRPTRTGTRLRQTSPIRKLAPTVEDEDGTSPVSSRPIGRACTLHGNQRVSCDTQTKLPVPSYIRDTLSSPAKSWHEMDLSINKENPSKPARARPTSMLLSSKGGSHAKIEGLSPQHIGPTLTLKDIVQTAITANQTRRGSLAPSVLMKPPISAMSDISMPIPLVNSKTNEVTHSSPAHSSSVSSPANRSAEALEQHSSTRLMSPHNPHASRAKSKGFRQGKHQLSKLDTSSTHVVSIKSSGVKLSASLGHSQNAYQKTPILSSHMEDLRWDAIIPEPTQPLSGKDEVKNDNDFDENATVQHAASRRTTHRGGLKANRRSTILSLPSECPGGAEMHISAINPETNEKLVWVRGELIGQGAFACVYLGVIIETGQCIAVKQVENSILAGDGSNTSGLARKNTAQRSRPAFGRKKSMFSPIIALRHELELLKGLVHPHVIQYLGFEQTLEYSNVFLEYVAGRSISSVLSKTGPFSEELILTISSQTLDGLDYLHGQGIIHRDIKAANLLVDIVACIVKISDFGISMKHVKGPYKRVSDLTVHGTVSWMSPETVRAKGYCAKVDIWSFGCTLIEMTTGLKPWSELTMDLQIFSQLARSKSPPIAANLSIELREFIDGCFIINPELRPTARELLSNPLITSINPYGFDLQSYYTTASEEWRLHRQPSLLTESDDDYESTDNGDIDCTDNDGDDEFQSD